MSWWLFPLIQNKKFIGLHIPLLPHTLLCINSDIWGTEVTSSPFYLQTILINRWFRQLYTILIITSLHAFFKVNIISLSNSATLFQITQSPESPIGKKFTVQRYPYLFHLSKTVQVFPQSAICKEQWASYRTLSSLFYQKHYLVLKTDGTLGRKAFPK